MEIVPAGTYEALEQSARRIANPAHFVLERLTGGGWDNLNGGPVTPTYPKPRINFARLERLPSLPDNVFKDEAA